MNIIVVFLYKRHHLQILNNKLNDMFLVIQYYPLIFSFPKLLFFILGCSTGTSKFENKMFTQKKKKKI